MGWSGNKTRERKMAIEQNQGNVLYVSYNEESNCMISQTLTSHGIWCGLI